MKYSFVENTLLSFDELLILEEWDPKKSRDQIVTLITYETKMKLTNNLKDQMIN